MYQHRCETRGADRLRLPMTVAKHAACIGGIDFNRFRDSGEAKIGPGKKVADDGLQMAVGKPRVRLKWSDPCGNLVICLSC